jgi:hypothetical protein
MASTIGVVVGSAGKSRKSQGRPRFLLPRPGGTFRDTVTDHVGPGARYAAVDGPELIYLDQLHWINLTKGRLFQERPRSTPKLWRSSAQPSPPDEPLCPP